MRCAYHWNDEATALVDMEDRWFRAALAATAPQRNLVIRTGNVSIAALPEPGARRLDALAAALGEQLGLWSSFTPESFEQLLARHSTLVMVVSGLTREEAVAIHGRLRRDAPEYVGAIEVDNRISVQWALFDRLPLRYRLVGRELRLVWPEMMGDDPPLGSLTDWQSRRLFTAVTFEDVGVRQSIFDAFDDHETARRVADTAARAAQRLQRLGDEVIDRCFDLDPLLVDALHAALRGLDEAETGEELAQAAVSLRRFIRRLADTLFPARQSLPGERKLGKPDYLNRLAAYAEQALAAQGSRSIGELAEIGNRLKSVIDQAHAGVHESDVRRSRVDRLIVASLSLTYDLLTLAEPPGRLPTKPHDQHVSDMFRDMRTYDE